MTIHQAYHTILFYHKTNVDIFQNWKVESKCFGQIPAFVFNYSNENNPKFTSFSVGDYLEKTDGWGKCTERWYRKQ
jgi:hypothetical protein